MRKAEHDLTGGEQVSDHVQMAGWGVEEATARNKMDASTCSSHLTLPKKRTLQEADCWRDTDGNLGLATQLALAYAIHKSFIFVRVPLTAAVTPKVVKILRGWGWDIGKRTTKEARALKRASNTAPLPKTKRK